MIIFLPRPCPMLKVRRPDREWEMAALQTSSACAEFSPRPESTTLSVHLVLWILQLETIKTDYQELLFMIVIKSLK